MTGEDEDIVRISEKKSYLKMGTRHRSEEPGI